MWVGSQVRNEGKKGFQGKKPLIAFPGASICNQSDRAINLGRCHTTSNIKPCSIPLPGGAPKHFRCNWNVPPFGARIWIVSLPAIGLAWTRNHGINSERRLLPGPVVQLRWSCQQWTCPHF